MPRGRKAIPETFDQSAHERFRNLLELANGSQYPGERANALAAATRLAERHGMSLEEAARWRPEPANARAAGARTADAAETDPAAYRPDRRTAKEWFQAWADQAAQEAAKARWEDAVREARARGLDREEEAAAAARSARRSFSSRAKRNPYSHAEVLLKETALPFIEIADITGLDVYTVVALKLKLRRAA